MLLTDITLTPTTGRRYSTRRHDPGATDPRLVSLGADLLLAAVAAGTTGVHRTAPQLRLQWAATSCPTVGVFRFVLVDHPRGALTVATTNIVAAGHHPGEADALAALSAELFPRQPGTALTDTTSRPALWTQVNDEVFTWRASEVRNVPALETAVALAFALLVRGGLHLTPDAARALLAVPDEPPLRFAMRSLEPTSGPSGPYRWPEHIPTLDPPDALVAAAARIRHLRRYDTADSHHPQHLLDDLIRRGLLTVQDRDLHRDVLIHAAVQAGGVHPVPLAPADGSDRRQTAAASFWAAARSRYPLPPPPPPPDPDGLARTAQRRLADALLADKPSWPQVVVALTVAQTYTDVDAVLARLAEQVGLTAPPPAAHHQEPVTLARAIATVERAGRDVAGIRRAWGITPHGPYQLPDDPANGVEWVAVRDDMHALLTNRGRATLQLDPAHPDDPARVVVHVVILGTVAAAALRTRLRSGDPHLIDPCAAARTLTACGLLPPGDAAAFADQLRWSASWAAGVVTRPDPIDFTRWYRLATLAAACACGAAAVAHNESVVGRLIDDTVELACDLSDGVD